jgi:hypothetical protein
VGGQSIDGRVIESRRGRQLDVETASHLFIVKRTVTTMLCGASNPFASRSLHVRLTHIPNGSRGAILRLETVDDNQLPASRHEA